MLNCSNFKTRLAQVLAKKDHEKHQHAKKCGHPRKGNKKGQCSSRTIPVNKHAVSLKCYYDQKNVNTKVTQVRTWSEPNYQKYMYEHVHRNDCYFKQENNSI